VVPSVSLPRTVEAVSEDAAAELADAVESRPFWTVNDQGAVYARPGGDAHVRVRPIATPARPRNRFIVSVIRGDRAEQSAPAGTAVAAIRWAESRALS
jgi:hypothetical protein